MSVNSRSAGEKALDALLVRLRNQGALPEVALGFRRLLVHDVTHESVTALYLAASRQLESFRRTAVRFHLRHNLSRLSYGPPACRPMLVASAARSPSSCSAPPSWVRTRP